MYVKMEGSYALLEPSILFVCIINPILQPIGYQFHKQPSSCN